MTKALKGPTLFRSHALRPFGLARTDRVAHVRRVITFHDADPIVVEAQNFQSVPLPLVKFAPISAITANDCQSKR